jgi:hypothetical protein
MPRKYQSNNHNLGMYVSTERKGTPGATMQAPSPVAPAVSADGLYVCTYIYCQATAALAVGEVVAIDTTSLTTVSNFKVTKSSTSTNGTSLVVGVVPGNLKNKFGELVDEVASGDYFWAVCKGIVKVLDAGTAAKNDVLTLSSTAGKVASAAGTGAGAIGVALEDKDPAGLVTSMINAPFVP